MPAASADLFRCPVCALPLQEVTSPSMTWRCDRHHSFDVGRDGTVHLLPAGHGKTRVVGDSAEMLQARRRFLQAGHYRALTTALATSTAQALDDTTDGVVADFGCGEGSHLAGVVAALSEHHVVVGLDLSKDAVKLAARTVKRARCVVGDSRLAIPLRDGVVDVGLVVFAPRGVGELARVIAVGGSLLVAIPEPDHLVELRTRWGGIGIADEKRERTIEELASGFALVDECVVDDMLTLDGAATADLLCMTPSRRHLDDDTLAAARAGSPLSVGLRVRLLRLQRRG
jgi:23S rRNA (guanine745-N1)-methyltransferase